MRNRDLRPAAKANPTIQQAFERFQKYNRLKNLSQGSLDFYAKSLCLSQKCDRRGLFCVEKTMLENKKVSSTVKMEDYGRKSALFHQFRRFCALYGHLMREYPVHLPAFSGQVRVHITLQGNVGVGVP